MIELYVTDFDENVFIPIVIFVRATNTEDHGRDCDLIYFLENYVPVLFLVSLVIFIRLTLPIAQKLSLLIND